MNYQKKIDFFDLFTHLLIQRQTIIFISSFIVNKNQKVIN